MHQAAAPETIAATCAPGAGACEGLDHEAALLLAWLRIGKSARPASGVPGVSPALWEAAARCAARHGVAPLVYRNLSELGPPADVPEPVLRRLREAYLWSAKRNVRLLHELGAVLSVLQQMGIPVIALKGAHLAEAIYGDMALRPMNDLDLLVPKDRLAQVEGALLELGYGPRQRPSVEIQVENRSGLQALAKQHVATIDVHWTIVKPGGPLAIELDGLWQRARPATIAGVPACVLADEDLLLHLAIHAGYQHAFGAGLRPLCDIGHLLARRGEELDWPSLAARARQWRAGRCLSLALRLSRELLAAPVPYQALTELEPGRVEPQWIRMAAQQAVGSGPGGAAGVLLTDDAAQLLRPRGLWQKAGLVLRRVFPSRRELAAFYAVPPDGLRVWLYYPVRLKDLTARYARLVWGRLWGDAGVQAALERHERATALRAWLASPEGRGQ